MSVETLVSTIWFSFSLPDSIYETLYVTDRRVFLIRLLDKICHASLQLQSDSILKRGPLSQN